MHNTAKLDRIAAIEQRIFDRVLKRGLIKLLPRKERPKDWLIFIGWPEAPLSSAGIRSR